MAADPFSHLRRTRPEQPKTHLTEQEFQHELRLKADHELLLAGVFIAGQCAALEDLSSAGLADRRMTRLAAVLKRQAEMLDAEGQARGLNLYGNQSGAH